ncbi:MAG: hypothetical protein MUF54_24460, partial [Polyangiaceae bacterium]|nr:hypothetical protein [Polyangiaceae bacterium]
GAAVAIVTAGAVEAAPRRLDVLAGVCPQLAKVTRARIEVGAVGAGQTATRNWEVDAGANAAAGLLALVLGARIMIVALGGAAAAEGLLHHPQGLGAVALHSACDGQHAAESQRQTCAPT